MALEMDLHTNDIDICVVSETHLRPDVPDVVIAISNYALFRRDRNWNGTDRRRNGGIAIYIRNNINVVDIQSSEEFEPIAITSSLPIGHHMLICGIYHPSQHSYQEKDLMSYLIDLADSLLEKFPGGLFVCGGDLNRCLVDAHWSTFPQRGESCFDNCFTGCPNLFDSCYPIHMSIKTDHEGVVLPPGIKLKPLRYKVQLRDCREHRRATLYFELEQTDCNHVCEAENIDEVVTRLETQILLLMNDCMPLRTVKMSSRDPFWMSPLIKH